MTTTTTTTSGAADLPEALRSIQRFEVVDCIDDKHVPAVIPKPHGPWVRYEDHIAALAAGQATAAQQGAAYAAQDSEHQLAIMEGERNASLDAYSRVVSITSAESRLYEIAFTSGWDRRDRLASYGQAPAQPAPQQDAQAAARPTPTHLEAMERAWLWMENQADGQSKGGHATFDLMMLREERDALRAAIDVAAPPTAQAEGWRPIETAPEGQMVVVGWLDKEDTETPERHDFDLLEDGCWQRWHDHAEHVQVIGGHGVSYTAPYTVWMPIGAIPPTSAEGVEHGL